MLEYRCRVEEINNEEYIVITAYDKISDRAFYTTIPWNEDPEIIAMELSASLTNLSELMKNKGID